MQILCVCTGNTCRSPMLAAMLRRALAAAGRDDIRVRSAGVAATPDQPASEHARSVMRERDLDLSTHRSTQLDAELIGGSDFVICMGPHHAAAVEDAGMPGERIAVAAVERGGVPDPIGGPIEEYRATADVLSAVADDVAARLTVNDPDVS